MPSHDERGLVCLRNLVVINILSSGLSLAKLFVVIKIKATVLLKDFLINDFVILD